MIKISREAHHGVHASNPNLEAKAEGLKVGGYPGLYSGTLSLTTERKKSRDSTSSMRAVMWTGDTTCRLGLRTGYGGIAPQGSYGRGRLSYCEGTGFGTRGMPQPYELLLPRIQVPFLTPTSGNSWLHVSSAQEHPTRPWAFMSTYLTPCTHNNSLFKRSY